MPKKRQLRGTGSVYRDSARNRWVGQITVDGRRHKVYAPTKTEARTRLNALLRGDVPARGRRPSGSRTLAELLEEWLVRDLAGRDRAPSTVNRHEWAVRHLTAELGGVRLDQLDVGAADDAMARLVDGGLGRWSVKAVLSTLQQALAYAVRRGEVGRNIATDTLVPAAAVKPKSRRVLSPVDSARLLAALANERNGAVYDLMLRCGLRPGEAAGLYWSDLDLEAGVVNVTRAVQRNGGRSAVADSLKTKRSKRTLRLPDELLARLVAHRRVQAAERLAASSWGDERLVFASPAGGVLDATKLRKQLADVCERAGVPETRPNELRHSCASYLIDSGVDIATVADVLGHTSTRMVDETYRHRLRPVMDVTALVSWPTSEAVQ